MNMLLNFEMKYNLIALSFAMRRRSFAAVPLTMLHFGPNPTKTKKCGRQKCSARLECCPDAALLVYTKYPYHCVLAKHRYDGV